MIRILVLSDIHASIGKVKRLANVEREITIIAGDLARCGSFEEAVQVLELLAEQNQPVIWVPGNCDDPRLANYEGPRGTVNIHGRFYAVNGVGFIGVGGSTPTPFSTPFEIGEDAIAETLFRAHASRVNDCSMLVLVSHAPPYLSGLDRVRSGEHVGSRSVRDFIRKHKPQLAVVGHIHEAWGVAAIGSTLVVNPGPLTNGRYATAFVDVEKGVVVVRLSRL